MGSALRLLFESETADRLIKFLRSRGERARIIAPAWVRERVMSDIPESEPVPQATWSEEVLASAPKVDGAWNFIVIADDAAKESAAVTSLALRKGMKAYGLFGDILPALLCGANGFGRGRSTRTVKRYAVLCIPRSGSRYLASMLNRAGLGAPQEHLREPLASVITDGKLGFVEAMEGLERFGQRNGIFGTKLISTFIIAASNEKLSVLEANIGAMVARGYQFVHLDRPLNDAVISSYIAFRLNKWHFFGELDTSTRNTLDELAFDDRAVWDEYIRFRAQKIVTDHLAQRFKVPSFPYSTVQQGAEEIIASICDRLNVKRDDLEPGSALIPVPTRRESQTYGDFEKSLEAVLASRHTEIVPRTIKELRRVAGVDERTAERLAAMAGPAK